MIVKNKILKIKENIKLAKGKEYIKYKFLDNDINLNSMFYKCSSLIKYKNIFTDKVKIKNIDYMFYQCNKLDSISGISDWNTSKIYNMECFLYGCSSLISLPEILNWNTNNVESIAAFFYECSSLQSIQIFQNGV